MGIIDPCCLIPESLFVSSVLHFMVESTHWHGEGVVGFFLHSRMCPILRIGKSDMASFGWLSADKTPKLAYEVQVCVVFLAGLFGRGF